MSNTTQTPAMMIRQTVTALDGALHEMEDRILRLTERAKSLDETLEKVTRRMARGTMQDEQPEQPDPVTEDTQPGKRLTPAPTRPMREVMSEIKTLLTARPRTYAELRELTNTAHPHTANALIQLQREGTSMRNLGSSRRAVWALARK